METTESVPNEEQLNPEILTVTETQRVLLKPNPTPPVEPVLISGKNLSAADLSYLWEEFHPEDGAMALDFETTGVNPESGDRIVTIGLADGRGAVAIDVTNDTTLAHDILLNLMLARVPLVGHNITFDGAFATALLSGLEFKPYHEWPHLNWVGCTYLLARLFSSEGPKTLKYGLKDLQVELLGWNQRGDVEVDDWLRDNGYVNQAKNVLKGEMHRVPFQILGKYCALDAYSTWLLYTRIMQPLMRKFPAVEQLLPAWMNHCRHLVVAQLAGIPVDVDKLRKLETILRREVEEAEREFRNQPRIRDGILQFNQMQVDKVLAEKPAAQFKKAKALSPEPPMFTKSGEFSARWQAWDARRDMLTRTPAEETHAFQAWRERLAEAESTQHFSISSPAHIRWLAYDYLGETVTLTTESGLPSVDSDALSMLGDEFKPLARWAEAQKLLTTYATSLLEKQRDGFVHPRFKVPGTNTGRLSGSGGINYQNLSKDLRLLDCLIAPPGMKLVIADYAALEPVVLAEVSRDENLLRLYGPGADPHDAYLFFGCFTPMYGPALRAAGYTPEKVTKDIVSACKKQFKAERQILKVAFLSFQYGAGWPKVRDTLRFSGVNINDTQAKALQTAYREMFAGRGKFEAKQQQVLSKNGWVLNAVGRPACIAQDWEKDVLSRIVQGGGHDVLVLGNAILADMLSGANIPYYVHIWDLHDAVMFLVRDEDVERTLELMRAPFHERLHALLNPDGQAVCLPKWEPAAVSAWSEDKKESDEELAKAREVWKGM